MIGGIIKQYRHAAKMTQEELAEKCGLNRNSIYKYEKGLCLPKPKHLALIASSLNIPSHEIGYALALGTGLPVSEVTSLWNVTEILQLITDSPFYKLVEHVGEHIQADFALETQENILKESGIGSGDVVLFKFADSPFNNNGEPDEGGIFLLEYQNELLIRHIAAVTSETITLAVLIQNKLRMDTLNISDVTIWGKAVGVLKRL